VQESCSMVMNSCEASQKTIQIMKTALSWFNMAISNATNT
jgi:hypothetical protein